MCIRDREQFRRKLPIKVEYFITPASAKRSSFKLVQRLESLIVSSISKINPVKCILSIVQGITSKLIILMLLKLISLLYPLGGVHDKAKILRLQHLWKCVISNNTFPCGKT